jgi:peptidoglycan hydrolase-like protein with peptidoglycan-binding domain
VATLQQALNTNYGASLVVDGYFGSKTQAALQKAGFNPSSVSEADFNTIVAGKSPTITTMSQTQLMALYNKEKASGATTLTFEQWLKKEQWKAKLKSFGQGLFTVTTEWLKAKQGAQPSVGDYIPTDDAGGRGAEDKVPVWVWVAGSAVALTLVVVIVVAVSKPKQVVVTQPAG